MKKSKYIIYVLIIILIIVILSYIIKNNKNFTDSENILNIEKIETNNGKYDLYDKDSNKLIVENISEEQMQLYIDNPDYNPSGM